MRSALPIAVAALLVSAAPASACLPPPPPNWLQWLDDPAVSIAVGRVVTVDRSGASETTGGFSVTTGVAHIHLLEVIQGEFATVHVETTGAIEYTPLPTRTADGQTITAGQIPCLTWLAFAEGDLALVVEGRGVFTAASATEEPALAARLEDYQ